MPKRVCPFDDDLSPQLKMHIGDKQVDNGVYSDERMKKVYDKTLSLLKEGSKILSQKLTASLQMDPIDLLSPKTSPTKAKESRVLKQMVLSYNLQLEKTDMLKNNVQTDLCGCCRIIDKNMLTKCYYCDQVLCSSCLSECFKCLETFCQNCLFNTYDGGEHSICLNCYQ